MSEEKEKSGLQDLLRTGRDAGIRVAATVEQKFHEADIPGKIKKNKAFFALKLVHRFSNSVGLYSKIFSPVTKIRDRAVEELKTRYNSLENAVTTDGEFDLQKTEALLLDKGKVVQEYGVKAYHNLVQIAKEAPGEIHRIYREKRPDIDELKSEKYRGMGEDYDGIPFREDLDDCIAFQEETMGKLSNGIRIRFPVGQKNRMTLDIINDIKRSLSGSREDLVEYYMCKSREEEGNLSYQERAQFVLENL